MATLYGNTVWEGTLAEGFPTYEDGARDGHFFKAIDEGESYVRRSGVWEYVNLGLAFIKATKSGSIVTDGSGNAEIVFNTSFLTDQYSIALSCHYDPSPPPVYPVSMWYDKLNTGFKIKTVKVIGGAPAGNVGVSWLATRDYDP